MNLQTSRPLPPGYWTLVAAGEPFRLLFPIGTAIGIIGVLLWPLFVWNFTAFYPGQIHARIMIEGFLGCFVMGFLGTALPRLLDTSRLTIYESGVFAAALVGTTWFHVMGATLWGDVIFFITLAAFVVTLVRRFLQRKDTPPPSFILVALGLCCGLVGTSLLILSQVTTALVPVWAFVAARRLLFQGFLLLPVMGVGAFLLPRFFGMPGRQNFPESLSLPPGWKPRAFFASVCGLTVIASFFVEAAGATRIAMILRAVAVSAYLVREIPVFAMTVGGGSLLLGLRIALLSVPFGYGLLIVFPDRMFTFLHVVFITGFSLLTFIVGSRVIFGHSGYSRLFAAKLLSVRLLIALIFIAMLTRVAADWMPDHRMSHYAHAALAWVCGVIIWAVRILPGVRKADCAD